MDFWVANVDAAVATVADQGGQILVQPYDIPNTGLRQAVVADPQDATLSRPSRPGRADPPLARWIDRY